MSVGETPACPNLFFGGLAGVVTYSTMISNYFRIHKLTALEIFTIRSRCRRQISSVHFATHRETTVKESSKMPESHSATGLLSFLSLNTSESSPTKFSVSHEPCDRFFGVQ
ncbi:hypothetical protein BN903_62 [Halorubrum sp. AJ67]|nr:hypothetical protein BN903_62 [Halorubrum sp. AJ67]